jgi:LPS export ABC transporter protein LptC
MRITKTQSRYFALAAIAIFFIVAGIFLSRSGGESSLALKTENKVKEEIIDTPKASLDVKDKNLEEKDEPKQDENSLVEMDNFERSQIRDGKVVWEIKAKRSVYNPELKITEIFDAVLNVYDDPERPVNLKAKSAKIQLSEGKPAFVEFNDTVNVKFGEEMFVDCNQAIYNILTGEIDARESVNVRGELFNITGERLLANLKTKKFEFVEHTKSILNKGKR